MAALAPVEPGGACAIRRTGVGCAAGHSLRAVQRLGRARTAHRDHAGHRGAAAAERAPLALAPGVAAGLRVRGVAGPMGVGAGRLLAELCRGGRAVCY